VALSIPARAVMPASPGVINYVEGNVLLDGQPITAKQIGSVQIGQNQILETTQGRAEVLLTPGVFLRIGANSAVRLIAAGLTDTRVEMLQGKALVEADDLHKGNHIRIMVAGAVTTLEKDGIYEFDTDSALVSVYEGKAIVQKGNNIATVEKGKQAFLTGPVVVAKFKRKYKDDLYKWSSLRSKYLTEASIAYA